MRCGHLFILLALFGGCLHYFLYRYIKSNYPLTYEDLEDEGIKPFHTPSPFYFWFILVSHWKYQNIVLSAVCVLDVIVFVLAIASMYQWEVVCKPPFKLD
jgi:hypothetical protein